MLNLTDVSRNVERSFQNRCRICLSLNTAGLVKIPCGCSGSIGFVHKVCLRRWMHTVRNFNTCEICRERYEFIVNGPGMRTLLITFARRPLLKLLKFVMLLILSYVVISMVFVSSFKVVEIQFTFSVYVSNFCSQLAADKIPPRFELHQQRHFRSSSAINRAFFNFCLLLLLLLYGQHCADKLSRLCFVSYRVVAQLPGDRRKQPPVAVTKYRWPLSDARYNATTIIQWNQPLKQ